MPLNLANIPAAANAFTQLQGDAAAMSNITAAAGALANTVSPLKIPETGELLAMVNRGQLTKARFNRMTAYQGKAFTTPDGFSSPLLWDGAVFTHSFADMDPLKTLWDKQATLYRFKPSIDEIMQMDLRNLVTPLTTQFLVQENCGGDPVWLQWYRELSKNPPPLSDLVRFAVREVFDPATVQQYGYHKEIPMAILPYFKMQGYGWDLPDNVPAGATNAVGNPVEGPENWMYKYWYAHWDLPSPTQGYEMLHRLYQSSDFGPSPALTPGTAFTNADMETLLKTLDYPEYWRRRLINISYHPINLTEARDAFKLGVGGEAQYYHSLRGQGYTDQDCKHIIEISKKKNERNIGLDPAKQTKSWICSHWQDGMLSDVDARQLMMNNGFTNPQAQAMLSKCKLDYSTKLNRSYIKGIRQGIINGVLSYSDAMNLFVSLGLQLTVMQQRLDLWVFQRATRYKLATTRELLQAHKAGAINDNDLDARLQNLGYVDGDRSRIVRGAQMTMMKQNTTALLKATKEAKAAADKILADAKKAAKEAARVAAANAKQAQAKIDQRARKIAAVSSDDNLKAWYDEGLFTLVDVYYRLFMRQYGLEDADRYVSKLDPSLSAGSKALAKSKAATIYHGEGNQPISTFEPSKAPV